MSRAICSTLPEGNPAQTHPMPSFEPCHPVPRFVLQMAVGPSPGCMRLYSDSFVTRRQRAHEFPNLPLPNRQMYSWHRSPPVTDQTSQSLLQFVFRSDTLKLPVALILPSATQRATLSIRFRPPHVKEQILASPASPAERKGGC